MANIIPRYRLLSHHHEILAHTPNYSCITVSLCPLGVPSRNEKYLASVAAGKWVLHKSFLEASRTAGRFVEEEEHEWGGEATEALLAKLREPAPKLAAAARKWRREMTKKRKVKGHGYCVIFVLMVAFYVGLSFGQQSLNIIFHSFIRLLLSSCRVSPFDFFFLPPSPPSSLFDTCTFFHSLHQDHITSDRFYSV